MDNFIVWFKVENEDSIDHGLYEYIMSLAYEGLERARQDFFDRKLLFSPCFNDLVVRIIDAVAKWDMGEGIREDEEEQLRNDMFAVWFCSYIEAEVRMHVKKCKIKLVKADYIGNNEFKILVRVNKR